MPQFKRFLLAMLLLVFSVTTGVDAQSLKTTIYKDGSFDIIGSKVTILNNYPGFDNKFLKPLNVKVVEQGDIKTIIYNLREGTFELRFAYEGKALTIDTKVTGQKNIPETISILRDAEVTGSKKVFKTSKQIMGNGGIIDWLDLKDEIINCGGITGFVPDSGSTLVISTRNYKKYNSYTNAYKDKVGKKLIEVYINTEKVSSQHLPTFYITENTAAFDAMRNEAIEAGKLMDVKNEKPQSYHWCSWYYAYYYLTDKMLSEYVSGFKKITPSVNIQTVQIDAGYHPHVGDWLEPSEKFPSGIGASIKEIITAGYKAGIWIGPYMVGNKSKLYREHPDWILRYKDNKPVIEMSFYGENRLWGAMDEEIYCLDTSNPKVMDHLRIVFKKFKELGISFYKTDFMLYGSKKTNEVIRFTPGKTSVEYQREFFDMIRQEIGQESFWLGCIAPFGPMLGYVDAMRISSDIHPIWSGATSMFEESKSAQHLNNVWWQNDPDAMPMRDQYTHLTAPEIRSVALWMGMLGGVINTSELFYEIAPNRTQLFRFLEPGKTKLNTAFPFLNSNEKLDVLVRKYSDESWAVLFTNRKEERVSSSFSLKRLVDVEKANCFDWDEAHADNLGSISNLNIDLLPHESRLFYISLDATSPAAMTLGGKIK
ncbi:MAG: glycoside hydrolase family 36 protein [Dyadobacter sp.]|uniref:glycoside hydrolase family 36 protein n=1 Tax=Dyadobacter sp. TaxID=1914288 RepID=UPI0032647383